MIIMGIDASTKASGVSIYNDGNLIYSTVINASSTDLFKRIEKQKNEIIAIFNKYKPDEIYLEDVLPEDVRNNQATFKALIYLQAALAIEFHKVNREINLIVASTWRSRCGITVGRGVKRETLKAAAIKFVKEKFNKDVTDDEADAICIGWAATHTKQGINLNGFELR